MVVVSFGYLIPKLTTSTADTEDAGPHAGHLFKKDDVLNLDASMHAANSPMQIIALHSLMILGLSRKRPTRDIGQIIFIPE